MEGEIRLEILEDDEFEARESFQVQIIDGSSAVHLATVWIEDNDEEGRFYEGIKTDLNQV